MFKVGNILVCVDTDYAPDFSENVSLKIGQKYTVSQAHEYDTDHVYLNGSEIGWVAKRFVLSEPTPEQTATQNFDAAMKAAWAESPSDTRDQRIRDADANAARNQPLVEAILLGHGFDIRSKVKPEPAFDYRQAYEKSTEVIDSLINIISNRPCYDVTLHSANVRKMVEDCDNCNFTNSSGTEEPCKDCRNNHLFMWQPQLIRGCHNCKNIGKHTVPLKYEPCLSCVKVWHASNGDNGLTQWQPQEEHDCDTCEYEHLPYDDCKECITDWLDNGEKGSTGYKAKTERNCKDCFFSNFPAVMTAVNSPCLTCQPGVRPHWWAKVANSPSETPPTAQEPVKVKVESRPIKKCYLCKDKALAVRLEPCLTCDKDSTDGYGHTQFTPKEDEKAEPEVSEARKQYDKLVVERRCIACKGCGLPANVYPCDGCWIPNANDNESIKEGLLSHPHFTPKPFKE